MIIGQHLHDATRAPTKVSEVPLHQLRGLRGLYRTENLPQARGRSNHNFSDLSDKRSELCRKGPEVGSETKTRLLSAVYYLAINDAITADKTIFMQSHIHL